MAQHEIQGFVANRLVSYLGSIVSGASNGGWHVASFTSEGTFQLNVQIIDNYGDGLLNTLNYSVLSSVLVA